MAEQSLIKVQEGLIAEIEPFGAESQRLLVKAEEQPVNDELQLASAVAVKKQITGHRKLVQDTRLNFTRQFDDVKKAIMNKEAEILLPLDKAQTVLGEKMLVYTEEQERIKEAEKRRVSELINHVDCGDVYKFKTVLEVEEDGARLKATYAGLNPEDQVNAEIKVVFTRSINRLEDRKAYLEEQARQEAERLELEKKAKEQSAERAELDRQKALNEVRERRIEAEKERLEREKQRKADEDAAEAERKKQATDERHRVKSGVRTVTSFEVTEPHLVPREYCTPDDKLIRAAVKDGIDVPGVKVTVERKV